MKRIPRKIARRVVWGIIALEGCVWVGFFLFPRQQRALCIASAVLLLALGAVMLSSFRCPDCGCQLRMEDKFCPKCGAKWEE